MDCFQIKGLRRRSLGMARAAVECSSMDAPSSRASIAGKDRCLFCRVKRPPSATTTSRSVHHDAPGVRIWMRPHAATFDDHLIVNLVMPRDGWSTRPLAFPCPRSPPRRSADPAGARQGRAAGVWGSGNLGIWRSAGYTPRTLRADDQRGLTTLRSRSRVAALKRMTVLLNSCASA